MNSTVTAGPRARSRLTLIVAGIFALLGSSVVTAPAQAGYYDASDPLFLPLRLPGLPPLPNLPP